MVEHDIRALLRMSAAVNGLVGDRIEPAPLTQGSALPAITYQRVGSVRQSALERPTGLAWPRIQIDCWAETADEAAELFEAVKGVLHGTVSVSHAIQLIEIVDGSDRPLFEPDVRLHRFTADYRVSHNEAA